MRGLAVGIWTLIAAIGLIPAHRPPAEAAYSRLEQAGYRAFYSLDYAAALADFRRLIRLEPQNPAAWNHLAQARLYQEMYRVGALAAELYGPSNAFLHVRLRRLNPRACQAFVAADSRARALARRELAQHPRESAANYALAAALGLRATYEFALRRAYLAAWRDTVRADRYARRSARERPDWAPPQLIVGVHDYVAGSLPWTVRWLARLEGLTGSRRQGLARLQRIAASAAPERIEARILLAVLDRREGWNRRAAAWLRRLSRAYPRNGLFALELARADQAAGRPRQALRDYTWLLRAPHHDAPSYARLPWAEIWLSLGRVHRQLGQSSLALQAFLQVEQMPATSASERQQAALSGGELEDLAGRRRAAVAQYRRCIALDSATPAARAARRWLRHPYRQGHAP
ncbi:MAG: tetratricopeptide repeat protein [Terriglobales bacterium]